MTRKRDCYFTNGSEVLREVQSTDFFEKDYTTEEETYTNTKGGKQSKIATRFDALYLIPEYCINVVLNILLQGKDKYGLDNWKLIETDDHINHAMRHLYLYTTGDRTENHLGNACCRCLFALYMANHNV